MIKCPSEVNVGTMVHVIGLQPTDKWGITQTYLNSRKEGAIGRVSGFFYGERKFLRVTHNTGEVAAYSHEELENLDR
jgi:hypothetical protein